VSNSVLRKNTLPLLRASAWFLMTTVLLCLPGSVFPQKSWFDKIWLDKWIHICLFSVMVFLWCWFVKKAKGKKIRVFIGLALCSFAYGIAMEFVQKYFIPNRSFEVKDMIADGVGSALGLLIAFKFL